jgi:hypothetical protein
MKKLSELIEDYCDSREEERDIDPEWDPIYNRQARSAYRQSLLDQIDTLVEELRSITN